MATVFCCDNPQTIYKNNAFMETNGIYFLLSHTPHEVLVLLVADCSLSCIPN